MVLQTDKIVLVHLLCTNGGRMLQEVVLRNMCSFYLKINKKYVLLPKIGVILKFIPFKISAGRDHNAYAIQTVSIWCAHPLKLKLLNILHQF